MRRCRNPRAHRVRARGVPSARVGAAVRSGRIARIVPEDVVDCSGRAPPTRSIGVTWPLHLPAKPQLPQGTSAHIGFYTAKAIQQEVPAILFRRDDSVEISRVVRSVAFSGRDRPPRTRRWRDVGLRDRQRRSQRWMAEGQVFLLSAPDDDRTLTLHRSRSHTADRSVPGRRTSATSRRRHPAGRTLNDGRFGLTG